MNGPVNHISAYRLADKIAVLHEYLFRHVYLFGKDHFTEHELKTEEKYGNYILIKPNFTGKC